MQRAKGDRRRKGADSLRTERFAQALSVTRVRVPVRCEDLGNAQRMAIQTDWFGRLKNNYKA